MTAACLCDGARDRQLRVPERGASKTPLGAIMYDRLAAASGSSRSRSKLPIGPSTADQSIGRSPIGRSGGQSEIGPVPRNEAHIGPRATEGQILEAERGGKVEGHPGSEDLVQGLVIGIGQLLRQLGDDLLCHRSSSTASVSADVILVLALQAEARGHGPSRQVARAAPLSRH
jgi:hypothetical protein